MSTKLWSPNKERIDATLLNRFLHDAENKFNISLPNYDAAWKWSIKKPEEFWRLVWDFCGVISATGPGPTMKPGKKIIDAEFFPEAKLNFAENMLRRSGSDAAIIFHAENGTRRELSWDELQANVASTARALMEMGVGKGDKVAGLMPNMPEAVIAMLATAAIGGVWSSCSPDFGTKGVLDRFGQIEPKVLFTANGYYYNCLSRICLRWFRTRCC